MMKHLLASAPLALFLLAGCSSQGGTSTDTSATNPVDSDGGADAAVTADAAPACVAPKKSGCGIDGSWINGVAHFDPAKVKNTTTSKLRVALRHGFALISGEEKIGGRLHAYSSFKVDVSKGEVAFSIDMCDLGTAMWSEENGPFHLVAFIDENDNNDLDTASSNETAIVIGTPDANELQSLTDVTISCHSGPQCLNVNLDCTGSSCLTVTPITQCKKKTPGCKSADAFCQ